MPLNVKQKLFKQSNYLPTEDKTGRARQLYISSELLKFLKMTMKYICIYENVLIYAILSLGKKIRQRGMLTLSINSEKINFIRADRKLPAWWINAG